jgi:hypothetical protein
LPEMTTDQKGAIAEQAVVLAAIKLGIEVYRPIAEGGRYDMIFDLGDQLNRVQCKWAGVYGDVVIVRCYSARRTGAGLVRRLYSADQIDSFAAYCAELDRCFWLPIAEFPGRSLVHLRLQHSRNNQRRRINWADDFDFAARLGGDQGAVAQLGERLAGSQKVTGSSPVGSIQNDLR